MIFLFGFPMLPYFVGQLVAFFMVPGKIVFHPEWNMVRDFPERAAAVGRSFQFDLELLSGSLLDLGIVIGRSSQMYSELLSGSLLDLGIAVGRSFQFDSELIP
eukprot:CAMPEP_0116137740 /NCGR_PEP_ID=MMETSP0329-20121206/12403_1 /TAXON_ID=697910 /ORGANISM="Pseudo-nitzschia arenysensis, Strain B593" /LENGTH=102 /DNA_ID=CAMNT_0003632663 /DNA_START=311 /DNA_END=619 /DNA_ORIENTATION=-